MDSSYVKQSAQPLILGTLSSCAKKSAALACADHRGDRGRVDARLHAVRVDDAAVAVDRPHVVPAGDAAAAPEHDHDVGVGARSLHRWPPPSAVAAGVGRRRRRASGRSASRRPVAGVLLAAGSPTGRHGAARGGRRER